MLLLYHCAHDKCRKYPDNPQLSIRILFPLPNIYFKLDFYNLKFVSHIKLIWNEYVRFQKIV